MDRMKKFSCFICRSLCGEDELQGSESYISELSSYNPNFILSPSVGLYWCFRPSTGEKESDGMEVCSEWLKAHGASLISDSNGDMLLDTKVSLLLNLPLSFS